MDVNTINLSEDDAESLKCDDRTIQLAFKAHQGSDFSFRFFFQLFLGSDFVKINSGTPTSKYLVITLTYSPKITNSDDSTSLN